ncbi:MAG: ABC transporter permease [Deltaproteobacteria bacterium]
MLASSRALFDELAQNVRLSVRGIARAPGFAAAVIVTLALGIGANAAMFGVVDRLMFRPFAYLRDPSSVHRVYFRNFNRGTERTFWNSEYARYVDLKNGTSSFSEYAAFAHMTAALGTGDASREHSAAMVSSTFWSFFDANPVMGRFFTAAEDRTPRGADVAVLGFAYWKNELGGRDVLGQTLQVGNVSATIIGVAPEGFAGVTDDDPPAVYIPITTYAGSNPYKRDAQTYFTAYYWRWMEIMVRTKPGVSAGQASADATRAAVNSWNARRALEPDIPPVTVAKPSAIVSSLRVGAGPSLALEARTALWVEGVAALVLLIACANVANLFLARALRRQREIAVRLALGVSRRRLLAQALTESLVLSLLGCAAGLLIAQWGGAAIRRMLISTQGASLDVFTDWRTIGVAVALTIVTGLLTGFVPALVSGRGDLAQDLRAGSRGGTYQRSRTRTALLVAQGALAVTLLVGAGLFVRSLDHVKSLPLGYDADRVLVVSPNMRGMVLDDSAQMQLGRAMLATAQALPGVEAASRAKTVPLTFVNSTNLFVPGVDSVARLGYITYQAASPDYFRAMDTRILRGRGFTAADRSGAPPVIVVGEGMAKTIWPHEDAIGKCVRVQVETATCSTVVGIAEDIAQNEISLAPRLHFYIPVEQFKYGGNFLLLRMRGNVRAQGETVRRAVQRVMPGQSYVTVRPLSEVVEGRRRSWQLGATMFVAFGFLALIVAAVGLYGVISYNVTQRMHEMGVRVALGAQPRDVVGLIAAQGFRFATAGIVLGSLFALAASHWVQPLLFQQSATDPFVYVAVSAAMLIVAIAASGIPALRAAKADPSVALRSD